MSLILSVLCASAVNGSEAIKHPTGGVRDHFLDAQRSAVVIVGKSVTCRKQVDVDVRLNMRGELEGEGVVPLNANVLHRIAFGVGDRKVALELVEAKAVAKILFRDVVAVAKSGHAGVVD